MIIIAFTSCQFLIRHGKPKVIGDNTFEYSLTHELFEVIWHGSLSKKIQVPTNVVNDLVCLLQRANLSSVKDSKDNLQPQHINKL